MEKEKRFDVWELTKENKKDLDSWINENRLIGIIDDVEGGIIGYIHDKHARNIINQLNK